MSYWLMGLVPILGIVRWTKILENATGYSIQNTVRQALILPTSREAKYKSGDRYVLHAFRRCASGAS